MGMWDIGVRLQLVPEHAETYEMEDVDEGGLGKI